MKRVITAVLLSFIGPGLGQIYNRDFRKGILLLFLSGALFLGPLLWLIAAVAPRLPDPAQQTITQEMVQAAAAEAIGPAKHFLNILSMAFLGVWAFSITQAYFRAKEISEAEAPPENPDFE